MKISIVFFTLFICFQAFANMDYYVSGALKLEHKTLDNRLLCPSETSPNKIKNIVRDLIHHHFPSLVKVYQDKRIQLREFTSDAYFLKTFFKLGHILKEKRVYFLDINTKLYECAPKQSALEAILAHELQHIADYKDSNSLQLIRLGIKMIGKKSRSAYERSTDYKIMDKGLSQGLREYRHWIYRRLNRKDLKTKKCFYYTPEEINRFLEGEQDFKDYFNKYCKN